MTEIVLLSLGFLFMLGFAAGLPALISMRYIREGKEELRAHLISMDRYNKAADLRQERWFRKLGYSTSLIFERVDRAEEEEQE